MDLPIFAALKRQMQWLNANQRVISQNVANADTPGYRAKEMERLDFGELLRQSETESQNKATFVPKVRMAATKAGHLGSEADGMPSAKESDKYEVNPDGNAVVLEEEMIKSSANQMEYSLMIGLYQKQVQILKSAMKSGR